MNTPDGGVDVAGGAPAPVLVTSSGAPAASSTGEWLGIDRAATPEPGTGVEPPDPWVAVGPDDVVQTVNSTLRFTNREGTLTAANEDMRAFFDFDNLDVPVGDPPVLTPVTIDGIGEPRWMYDSTHNRWLGTMLGWHCADATVTTAMGFVFGAISLTGDPTGDYYQYYLQYNGFIPESPMMGISGDKLAISANEFTLPGTAAPGCANGIGFDTDYAASLTALDWADMLSYPAEPASTYVSFRDLFGLRPAVSPKGLTNTIFVVGEVLIADLDRPGDFIREATHSSVAYMRITGPNAGVDVVVSPPQDLTAISVVGPFFDPPNPVEPEGVVAAGIVDRRPTDAIWQDDVLTFASTYPCNPPGGASENRACARVTQLNTAIPEPVLLQDMLIGTNAKDTWYPGVGQSQSGILHVVYTESSPTEGMSSFDRFQLPADDPNELSNPIELADGHGDNYTGTKWGRYVGVAQDPRDSNAVWQGNQFTKSDGTWGTLVSQLQTAGARFVGIAPVRVFDSRNTTILTDNVPRTVQITGVSGIPANAVAITGNLTVTGQQAAGLAALTPLPLTNPTTSTLNFPATGSRANNITSPLSNTGTVSLTYDTSGVTTKKAHLILDVTGYFLNGTANDGYNVVTPEPVRVLDTRDDIGLTDHFVVNVAREFQVGNTTGIPATATAITGNLTVVGQTATGLIALSTDEPLPTPATSTLNFTSLNAVANGVTVKLNGAGKLWAVFKSSVAGVKTTDLILDVTGYYTAAGGASFVPLTPGRRLDTRIAAPQEGLTGAFSGNVARTLVIEPYQGVPVNATAITGNLTVVGHTRGGFVAMTPIADNDPPTSTLNLVVGDIRANGVTGPLSGAGSIGLTYRTSGGGTAHLILDLTGYFR